MGAERGLCLMLMRYGADARLRQSCRTGAASNNRAQQDELEEQTACGWWCVWLSGCLRGWLQRARSVHRSAACLCIMSACLSHLEARRRATAWDLLADEVRPGLGSAIPRLYRHRSHHALPRRRVAVYIGPGLRLSHGAAQRLRRRARHAVGARLHLLLERHGEGIGGLGHRGAVQQGLVVARVARRRHGWREAGRSGASLSQERPRTCPALQCSCSLYAGALRAVRIRPQKEKDLRGV